MDISILWQDVGKTKTFRQKVEEAIKRFGIRTGIKPNAIEVPPSTLVEDLQSIQDLKLDVRQDPKLPAGHFSIGLVQPKEKS